MSNWLIEIRCFVDPPDQLIENQIINAMETLGFDYFGKSRGSNADFTSIVFDKMKEEKNE